MNKLLSLFLGLGLLAAAPPAGADHTAGVRRVDVQRLQDNLTTLEESLNTIPTNHARYREFQDRAETVREDVTHLKVEMRRHQRNRKEGLGASVEDVKYLTEEIQRLQDDMDGALDRRWSSGTADLATGTTIQARLDTPLSSATAQREDRVRALVARPVYHNSRMVIPSGATLEGVVTRVERAQRPARGGQLELSFNRLRLTDGTTMDIDTRVAEIREDVGSGEKAGRAGIGAALGGILGAVLGGTKGALIGVLVGGGGGVISARGDDVVLPEGTVLTLELERPINLRR